VTAVSWATLELVEATTEPSADRGPRRGSPAGVVDAPDPGVYFSFLGIRARLSLKILQGSGATARGSLSQVRLFNISAPTQLASCEVAPRP
jgi:hypothetical protein